jgi:transcriptional regulator with XRE-family HTH domain
LLVRALRGRAVLSQRELARRARLPHSTVDRIEAGTSMPRYDTLCRLVRAADCRLSFTDSGGQPVTPDSDHDRLVDQADRRFPAHLPAHPVRDPSSWDWWGWCRIAWSIRDPIVPSHTYYQRRSPRHSRYWRRHRWDEVT